LTSPPADDTFSVVSFFLRLYFGTVLLVGSLAVFMASSPIGLFGLSWLAADIIKLSTGSVMIVGAVSLFISAARLYPREVLRRNCR
jgi:hypothetical protein